MKKLLALLLALMCMLSFAACDDEKDRKKKDDNDTKVEEKQNNGEEPSEKKKPKKELTEEELAEETVIGFMDAFMDLDKDGMESYLDDPSSVSDILDMYDTEKLADEQFPAEMSEYKDDFIDVMDVYFEKVSDLMSYEITDVNEEDGVYTFTVESDVVGEEEAGILDGEEVLETLVSEGKITQDMSQDEILTIYFEEMANQIRKADFDTRTETGTVVVYEKDGEWVVNAKESTIFEG
ncbi:MAG: hypothetical protein E7415_01520 [Ruminococcaceae bacterium]|nr:hypothetical protein [Oscillospiraceae bacterium]